METLINDLSSILNFFLKIFCKDFSMFSFFVEAKNPSLPVLIPNIGILLFLTYSIDLKNVPSPPTLINKSTSSFRSFAFEYLK